MTHAFLTALGILAAVVAVALLTGSVLLAVIYAVERRHDADLDAEFEQLLNDADAHHKH